MRVNIGPRIVNRVFFPELDWRAISDVSTNLARIGYYASLPSVCNDAVKLVLETEVAPVVSYSTLLQSGHLDMEVVMFEFLDAIRHALHTHGLGDVLAKYLLMR